MAMPRVFGKRTINGKVINDAVEPINVHVSKADCRVGMQNDAQSCAIARGFLHDRNIKSVRIGRAVAIVEFKDKALRYGIPVEAQQQIKAFDVAHYFAPGDYTLVPPKPRAEPGSPKNKRNKRRAYKDRRPAGKRAGNVADKKAAPQGFRNLSSGTGFANTGAR